jgi:hypothetical protein
VYLRHQVARNIRKLYQQQGRNRPYNDKQNKEDRIIKQIRSKLTKNKVMVSKADKGNSVVISYQEEYNQKVDEFISKNNVTVMKTDITKKLQRKIRSTVID